MTAVSPLVFPGSRTLAGWWKQLAPLQPRALWAGHLLLHRVEALAAVQLVSRVDAVSLFVLKAVALSRGGPLPQLDQHLHLGLSLLRRLLQRLERENLLRAEQGEIWAVTAVGRQALEQGCYTQLQHQRRAFYFVDPEQPTRPPHFLGFRHPPAALPWAAGADWKFEPSYLAVCVAKPADWKRQFGFPLEIEQILGDGSASGAPPEWRQVMVDRPERLPAALVLAPAADGRERLLGFAVHPEGWLLQSVDPAFVIEADWQQAFPQLAVDISLDQWLDAWRTWCQPRGLPAAEVAACILERQSHRLRVPAAPRLIERLRAARSDVFKGEAWLLAGTGRLRSAAQLDLVEMKRERVARATSEKV